MKAKVSFVVISHNDGNIVVRAIESIKKLKTKTKTEIFLVDNGSTDGSIQKIKARFKDVNVIGLGRNIGTAAYDRAVKKAHGKYIFFTGGDIELKSDMLDKLVDFLDQNEYAVHAAPKYVDFYNRKKIDLGGTWLSRSFYSGTFKDYTLGNEVTEIPYIGTGLIRADFIKKFGYLFDNDYFFYGEDVDLGLRIRLLGYKVYYVPNSIVYHVGSASRRIHKPYYLTFLMERNLLRTFFTTLSIKNVVIFLPYVVFARFVAMIKDLIALKPMNAFARIYAILWVSMNFKKIAVKRGKVQSMRLVNDDTLLDYFNERYLLNILRR